MSRVLLDGDTLEPVQVRAVKTPKGGTVPRGRVQNAFSRGLTDKLAGMGLAIAETAGVPKGKRKVSETYERDKSGKVVAVPVFEDKPAERELSRAEKVDRMLSAHNLTRAELAAELREEI